ncbi:MAG: DUF86 domain-containing protein [Candidatus Hodarchaeales archaeon]|jgi:uncharacterized protein YutE (UPF0331/DUF86 family)
MNKEYLQSRVKEIENTIDELHRLTAIPFAELSLDQRYSTRYQIIVLVEAVGSICFHIALQDLDKEPRSYAECFKLLEAKDLLRSSSEILKIARLRNLLVHRYWIIDDEMIYKAIQEDFKGIADFLTDVTTHYGL